MTDEIKPALTVDEWADFTTDARALTGVLSNIGDGVGLYADDYSLSYQHASPERQHHAGMALHNYALPDGHPGKITREDADLLLETAMKLDATMGDPLIASMLDVERPGRVRTLAAKLAALLRPEGA